MIDEKNRGQSEFVRSPKNQELLRFSGIIRNYTSTRDEASFVFSENDKSAMGVIAVSAALVGLGGQAIALASNASSLEEAADYIEFEIEDKNFKGWLWRSPFNNGDEVHVAAEWTGEHYEVFGISRPLDRTIALYPHCSRGRRRHFKNAFKWWFIILLVSFISLFMIDYLDEYSLQSSIDGWARTFKDGIGWWLLLGLLFALTVPVISLTKKWMPFVRVAEKVFKSLGLSNAKNIDLVKSSKLQRKSDDPPEFGSMYFRY